jgi:hypothetical protein
MLQFFLHCIQAGLSGYVLYHASISVPNLQQYESKSKKAAKYSQVAADQLHKTRSTQTAGTIAVSFIFQPLHPNLTSISQGIFSTAASLLLGFHIITSGPKSLILNVAAGLATAGASVHMGGFWDEKGKVPFMTDYNDAVDSSKVIRGHLALIGLLWGVSSFFSLFEVL